MDIKIVVAILFVVLQLFVPISFYFNETSVTEDCSPNEELKKITFEMPHRLDCSLTDETYHFEYLETKLDLIKSKEKMTSNKLALVSENVIIVLDKLIGAKVYNRKFLRINDENDYQRTWDNFLINSTKENFWERYAPLATVIPWHLFTFPKGFIGKNLLIQGAILLYKISRLNFNKIIDIKEEILNKINSLSWFSYAKRVDEMKKLISEFGNSLYNIECQKHNNMLYKAKTINNYQDRIRFLFNTNDISTDMDEDKKEIFLCQNFTSYFSVGNKKIKALNMSTTFSKIRSWIRNYFLIIVVYQLSIIIICFVLHFYSNGKTYSNVQKTNNLNVSFDINQDCVKIT